MPRVFPCFKALWLKGSFLKPKTQSRFKFCLLVQIKMTVSRPLLYHLKTLIKQHKENRKQMHQRIDL